MKHAADMDIKELMDEVSHEMRNYESEFGTKQSCSYEVRHFYKKLYFNPGICFDQNPFPCPSVLKSTDNNLTVNSGIREEKTQQLPDILARKIQMSAEVQNGNSCLIENQDIESNFVVPKPGVPRLPRNDNSLRNSLCESCGSDIGTSEKDNENEPTSKGCEELGFDQVNKMFV